MHTTFIGWNHAQSVKMEDDCEIHISHMLHLMLAYTVPPLNLNGPRNFSTMTISPLTTIYSYFANSYKINTKQTLRPHTTHVLISYNLRAKDSFAHLLKLQTSPSLPRNAIRTKDIISTKPEHTFELCHLQGSNGYGKDLMKIKHTPWPTSYTYHLKILPPKFYGKFKDMTQSSLKRDQKNITQTTIAKHYTLQP